jgi:hypothetical protein
MLIAKMPKFQILCKVNIFPPKFPFSKGKRIIWREKIYFANERGTFSF